MMDNKFRITLFNTYRKDTLVTYDYPLLPKIGDCIAFQIRNSSPDLFMINGREFTSFNDSELLEVTLFGMMEAENDLPWASWERVKKDIQKLHEPLTNLDICESRPLFDIEE